MKKWNKRLRSEGNTQRWMPRQNGSRLWNANDGVSVRTQGGLVFLPWVTLLAEVSSMCSRFFTCFPGVDPDDVVQEVAIELMKAGFGQHFDGSSESIRPYLYGIVQNVGRRFARRCRVTCLQNTGALPEVAGQVEAPEKVAEGNELRDAIVAIMPLLTRTERNTLRVLLASAKGDHGLPLHCRGPKWDVRICRLRAKLVTVFLRKGWFALLAIIDRGRAGS